MALMKVIYVNHLSKFKIFPAPNLQPVDLNVQLKLMEKITSYHLSRILLMKSSNLRICH